MTTFRLHDDVPSPGMKPTAGDLFDGLVDAAAGKPLPGKAGLIQALVCCWSQPRMNTWPPLHYAKLALNTAGIVRKYREVNDPKFSEQRKDPVREWLDANGLRHCHEVGALHNMVFTYSQHVPHEDRSLPECEHWIRVFTLPGSVTYAYVMTESGDNETGTGPYVRSSDVDRFVSEIGSLIWRVEGHDDLQLTARIVYSPYGSSASSFALSNIGTADDYVDDGGTLTSVAGLATRVKAFASRGIGRNILFYGPPGTGKTTIGRRLAREIGGGRTLRVEAAAVDKAGPHAVLAFVRLLRPRVMMFDDMDRCMGVVVELLHTLEMAARDVAVTIVGTINVIEVVDPALLRPGRFDEVLFLGEPTDEHRAAIVAHYGAKYGVLLPTGAVDAMKGFAQADIREVIQAVATVGVDHLEAEVDRVGRQRKLYAGPACREHMLARVAGNSVSSAKVA